MIECNKTYKFLISEISFGEISKEELCEIFKDGRYSSALMEIQFTRWFPELIRQPGNKSYDHFDNLGNKYDAKAFTKNGCKFMPSSQIGSGRKFNIKEAENKVLENNYIIYDVNNFPYIEVVFKQGIDLAIEYPKFYIPFNKRKDFFG